MGGESRAAHAGDAGLLHNVDDLLGSEHIHIVPVPDCLAGGVLEVVLDHYGHHLAAASMGPGLHGHDLAGDAGVDGRAKSGDLADLLSDGDLVSHGHDGLTGRAHIGITTWAGASSSGMTGLRSVASLCSAGWTPP